MYHNRMKSEAGAVMSDDTALEMYAMRDRFGTSFRHNPNNLDVHRGGHSSAGHDVGSMFFFHRRPKLQVSPRQETVLCFTSTAAHTYPNEVESVSHVNLVKSLGEQPKPKPAMDDNLQSGQR
jgi:hypothetical protein